MHATIPGSYSTSGLVLSVLDPRILLLKNVNVVIIVDKAAVMYRRIWFWPS
jgi:hypothetical protein